MYIDLFVAALIGICLLVFLLLVIYILINRFKSLEYNLKEAVLKETISASNINIKAVSADVQQNLTLFENIISNNFTNQQSLISQKLSEITSSLNQQLHVIRGKVEDSLAANLEKSHHIYADITKRLALIDNAQQNIAELSSNVVNLQSILSDKQLRGLFGEVQLQNIVKNILPSNNYAFQVALPNQKRADCMITLPSPVGNLIIDAKFPLQNYKDYNSTVKTTADYDVAQKQFKRDLKKHIDDISGKYIIENFTADMAMMFIPAESVFAEIHSSHLDVVSYAQSKRVWITSPATTMAVLNTFSAVIKDLKRQKEIKVIQEHLNLLSKDFNRFTLRMDNLAKHIRQASEDVENVNASAKKISSRFNKIENVEIESTKNNTLK